MEIELYVKEHNVTGMKYFGKHKVCSTSISEYPGSGTDWTEHLLEHGDDVTTHSVGIWDETDPELTYAAKSISSHFDIVNSKEWANMKIEDGHEGGWDYVNENGLNNIAGNNIEGGTTVKNKWQYDKQWALSQKEQMPSRPQNKAFGMYGNTEKAMKKKKAVYKKNKHAQGSKNSQFGTMWITNETESKKIPRGDLIPNGWRAGRKMK